jgi:hypothetical protein
MRYRRNELGIIGLLEFLVPTHQLVGDLVWGVGTKVETIREVAHGRQINRLTGDVLHTQNLLSSRMAGKQCWSTPIIVPGGRQWLARSSCRQGGGDE